MKEAVIRMETTARPTTDRSASPRLLKGLLLAITLVALLATTVVCEIPALATAFEFTAVTFREYAAAIGLGFLVIPIVEIVKAFQRGAARKSRENS